MNNQLQKGLDDLNNLIGIQHRCLCDNYMIGMLNGMIFSRTLFSNYPPKYYTCSNRHKQTKIRHKSRK